MPRIDHFIATERQLTSREQNHLLTNVNAWSHDGQWIYYDVRSDAAGSVFDGTRIERVHAIDGRVEVIYQATRGACVGVVTASQNEDRIVFIHGPEAPTNDWQYCAWHRRGVLTKPACPESISNLDARDLVSPYTAGALRGGTHVHVFSGDGQWVSFTYEDHVLATAKNPLAAKNQRNVGISAPFGPVRVSRGHERNHDGEAFSVLVTQTADLPAPGSDEISRAYEDAWIGTDGYARSDGTHQHRALAFIGDVMGRDGQTWPELFIVDIPGDVTIDGTASLCGTPLTRPAPPDGCKQRRITYTQLRKYPGLAPVRHWPRSSPDGRRIAFLMRDVDARNQLWLVSPNGGEPCQVTHGDCSIESAFTFRPDGIAIACVANGCICEINVESGTLTPLTSPSHRDSEIRTEAVVYSPDGSRIAYVRRTKLPGNEFNQIFVVDSGISLDFCSGPGSE
jgi:hypothetical protein